MNILTRKKVALVFLATALIYLALAVAIAKTKAPWCDEGWFANPAYNLAHRGVMGTTVLEPTGHFLNVNLQGIQQRTYYVMPLHLLVLAGGYKLFGFSLLVTRMVGILWGFVALGSLFFIIRAITNRLSIAVLAVIITALDFTFLWGAADGRMEMMCLALGLCGQAVYLSLRKRHLGVAIGLSHLCLAASVLTHPNAMLPFFGLAYLTLHLDRRRLRIRHLMLAGAPYLAGFAAWGVYILDSPQDFIAQFFANAAGRDSERLNQIIKPWESIWLELAGRYLAHYGLYTVIWVGRMPWWYAAAPVIYISVLIRCLCSKSFRRSKNYRTLLALTMINVFSMTFLIGTKAQNYMVFLVPWYNTLVVAWALDRWRLKADAKLLSGFTVAALLTVQIGTTFTKIRENAYERDYLQVIRYLNQNAGAREVVFAPATLGFDYPFDHFTDDVRVGYHTGRHPDLLVVDPFYKQMHDGIIPEQEPQVSKYLTDLLETHYHSVYENHYYTILRRNREQALAAQALINSSY